MREIEPISQEAFISTPEQPHLIEEEQPFNISVCIAHHPDNRFTEEVNEQLYKELKENGISAIRYDFRWNLCEEERGSSDQYQLDRNQYQLNHYGRERINMRAAGLDEPTIILSSIPDWAIELYKQDKEAFFTAFRGYAEQVKQTLEATDRDGSKVSKIQVLGELNMPNYTPIEDMNDIARLCRETKEIFKTYNSNIQILTGVMVGTWPIQSKSLRLRYDVREYLQRLETIKDSFDVIVLDYYPGGWQRSITGSGIEKANNVRKRLITPGTESYKEMFKEMELLRETIKNVTSWEKAYEIGETGFPTKGIYWGDERRQRYYFDTFFREFKHMLTDLRSEGISLPTSIGLYEAVDEPPQDIKSKLLRALTPYPELDYGIINSRGKKLIMQGRKNKSTLPVRQGNVNQSGSRLTALIKYLNSPVKTPKN